MVDYIRKVGIPDGPLLGKLQKGVGVTFKGKKIPVEKATYIVKGKKIGIISDTRTCTGCLKVAKDKDLLISDSTFANKEEEKAHEYYHMTCVQAANIAAQAGAKILQEIPLLSTGALLGTTETISIGGQIQQMSVHILIEALVMI